MKSILLDRSSWDLVLDIDGNIAVASDPYSQAQDAASACKLFRGECWYDTTIGAQFSLILGKLPPISLVKQQFVASALSVPGVEAAKCFVTGISGRSLGGQVQVVNAAGQSAATSF